MAVCLTWHTPRGCCRRQPKTCRHAYLPVKVLSFRQPKQAKSEVAVQAASRGVNRRLSKQALLDRADTHEALSSTQRTVLSIRRAMYLYDLTGSELFCELKRDTRCLMGWNDNTIVLAFRGTASMTNALSDLQVIPAIA